MLLQCDSTCPSQHNFQTPVVLVAAAVAVDVAAVAAAVVVVATVAVVVVVVVVASERWARLDKSCATSAQPGTVKRPRLVALPTVTAKTLVWG